MKVVVKAPDEESMLVIPALSLQNFETRQVNTLPQAESSNRSL